VFLTFSCCFEVMLFF